MLCLAGYDICFLAQKSATLLLNIKPEKSLFLTFKPGKTSKLPFTEIFARYSNLWLITLYAPVGSLKLIMFRTISQTLSTIFKIFVVNTVMHGFQSGLSNYLTTFSILGPYD